MPEHIADNFADCELLWIVIGDIHDQTGNFGKIPELDRATGVIISGDLSNCGGREDAARVMLAIRERGLPVLAQIGNMDKAEIDDWLTGEGVNLHGKTRELAPEIAVFGVGGSTITPMKTCSEFPEEAYAAWLAEEWKTADKYPLTILVSHNPPRDTVCDAINDSLHVGSTAVREFIEKEQPDLCLCGHIHEGRGEDRIGKTLVLNPGTLASGGYIVVCYKHGQLTAKLARV